MNLIKIILVSFTLAFFITACKKNKPPVPQTPEQACPKFYVPLKFLADAQEELNKTASSDAAKIAQIISSIKPSCDTLKALGDTSCTAGEKVLKASDGTKICSEIAAKAAPSN